MIWGKGTPNGFWYAWYPVKYWEPDKLGGKWAWLEMVYRKRWGGSWWYYSEERPNW